MGRTVAKVTIVFSLFLLLNIYLLPTNGSCLVPFKVYVYDIPKALLLRGEEARKNQTYHVCKKCIYEQFALEYVIFDYFTQFCGRTYNPEEADYFYLPIIRDIDYRIALSSSGSRTPSPIDQALIDIMEKSDSTTWKQVFQVSDQYWQRHNGSDHIIVMPAPVTNFRHQTSRRGYFHYMLQLANPIFLNVELSKLFIQEYPICSTQKNIVVPYPTTDSDLYSYNYFPVALQQSLSQILQKTPHTNPETLQKHFIDYLTSKHQRSKLLFYQGGNHGSCVKVRQSLTSLTKGPTTKEYFIVKGDKKREEGFLSAIFCPIPIGDSPSSKRMYDAIHFGCIPVLLSDEITYAYSTIAGGMVDIHSFAIQLPQRMVHKSIDEIWSSGITPEQINGNVTLPLGQSVWTILQTIHSEYQQQAQTKTLSIKENSSPKTTTSINVPPAIDTGLKTERKKEQRSKNKDKSLTGNKIMNIIRQSENENARNEPELIATVLDSTSSVVPSFTPKQPQQPNQRQQRSLQQGEAGGKAKKGWKVGKNTDSTTTTTTSPSPSLLLEILQRIHPKEILQLRRNALLHSQTHYLYYAMNTSALLLTPQSKKVLPPYTAMNTFPTGGAIQTLETLLSQRKKEGVVMIGQACQKERDQPGHKYIGQYICDKRRRLQLRMEQDEEQKMIQHTLCQYNQS